MKKSGVLTAALVLTFASTIMAADSGTAAPAEADVISPKVLAFEKSHISKPAAPEETGAQGGCCACPADPTVTGDVYIGPISNYLFRGNSFSKPGSDFAIQGGIDLYYKAFTLSYWGNALNRYSRSVYSDPDTGEFTGYKRSKVNETDLILDYAVPYTIPYLDNLKFNVGTQYFAVDGTEDTNEFYVKASYDTLLKPTLTVYWDNLAATRAGLFYTASISHKITIERNLYALNLGALVSYNQNNPNAAFTAEGDGVYSGWHNYELTASFDYTPTANITITPSYMFSNYVSDKAQAFGIKAQNAFGIKAMFAF